MSELAFQTPATVPARDEVRAVLGAAAVNGFTCTELDSRQAVFDRGVGDEHLALYVSFRDDRLLSANLIGVWSDLAEIRHRYDHGDEHAFDFIERLIQAADHVRIATQTARSATESRSLFPYGKTTVRHLHSKPTRNPR